MGSESKKARIRGAGSWQVCRLIGDASGRLQLGNLTALKLSVYVRFPAVTESNTVTPKTDPGGAQKGRDKNDCATRFARAVTTSATTLVQPYQKLGTVPGDVLIPP